jgi:predicted ATPase
MIRASTEPSTVKICSSAGNGPCTTVKLDALLAQTSTSIQEAALIADMLSLPNDGRYPALELTPQQRRQKTLEALTTQLETLSQQKPVLMVFEDAHWADPTSLEAFGRVVDRIRTLAAGGEAASTRLARKWLCDMAALRRIPRGPA